MFLLNKAEQSRSYKVRCMGDHNREQSLPPEVIVGHVEIFQCKQEVVKGLDRDFDQLVVVDNQVLQIDQTCKVPRAKYCQAVT